MFHFPYPSSGALQNRPFRSPMLLSHNTARSILETQRIRIVVRPDTGYPTTPRSRQSTHLRHPNLNTPHLGPPLKALRSSHIHLFPFQSCPPRLTPAISFPLPPPLPPRPPLPSRNTNSVPPPGEEIRNSHFLQHQQQYNQRPDSQVHVVHLKQEGELERLTVPVRVLAESSSEQRRPQHSVRMSERGRRDVQLDKQREILKNGACTFTVDLNSACLLAHGSAPDARTTTFSCDAL